jgi:hypothetical protein
MSKTPTCTYHCRQCESHFSSLEAFDAHGPGRPCKWPDDSRLVEIAGGVCRIGDPDVPKLNVTLYAAQRGQAAKDRLEGLQALDPKAREAA